MHNKIYFQFHDLGDFSFSKKDILDIAVSLVQ